MRLLGGIAVNNTHCGWYIWRYKSDYSIRGRQFGISSVGELRTAVPFGFRDLFALDVKFSRLIVESL